MAGIIFNIFWILGLLIIVITVSYCEFLAYLYEKKRRDVYQKRGFKVSFLLGSILIAAGVLLSSLFHPSETQPEFPKEFINLENPASFPPNILFRRDREFELPLWMNRRIILRSEFILFEKSDYEIRISTRGTRASNEYPKVLLLIGHEPVAEFFATRGIREKVFEFRSRSRRPKKLVLDFVNDFSSPDGNEERKLYIRSIVIKKMRQKPKNFTMMLKKYWPEILTGMFIMAIFFWIALKRPRWEIQVDERNNRG